jgi:prepilin-type N-terminal cleavage/methylation domain-containing protein
MKSRRFTLIELLIALLLLSIASGVIGVKMHTAVAKKAFQSELDRLKDRLMTTQKLAVAMEADWRAILKKNDKKWTLEIYCDEGEERKLSPLNLNSMEIFFKGKKVDELAIDFYASGKVLPDGVLQFTHQKEKVEWAIHSLFPREEGTKFGPLRPNQN